MLEERIGQHETSSGGHLVVEVDAETGEGYCPNCGVDVMDDNRGEPLLPDDLASPSMDGYSYCECECGSVLGIKLSDYDKLKEESRIKADSYGEEWLEDYHAHYGIDGEDYRIEFLGDNGVGHYGWEIEIFDKYGEMVQSMSIAVDFNEQRDNPEIRIL